MKAAEKLKARMGGLNLDVAIKAMKIVCRVNKCTPPEALALVKQKFESDGIETPEIFISATVDMITRAASKEKTK